MGRIFAIHRNDIFMIDHKFNGSFGSYHLSIEIVGFKKCQLKNASNHLKYLQQMRLNEKMQYM